jgi:hypothetical protein
LKVYTTSNHRANNQVSRKEEIPSTPHPSHECPLVVGRQKKNALGTLQHWYLEEWLEY